MKCDRAHGLVLILLLLSSAAAQAPAPQLAALPVGQVTIAAIKGAATFKSAAGADIPGNSGQALAPGSIIETGKGSIVLNLQDGSQVQVKGNSRVVVQDPVQEQHFSLEMLLGKVIAKIQKRMGAAPSFRMGTPTAVITVRGTEFLVEVDKKGRTDVYVYDGLVEVLGFTTTSPPMLVRPGFYGEVERNRPPERPRRFGVGGSQGGPGDDPRTRAGEGRDDDRSGSRSGESDDRESSTQTSTERDR